MRVFVTGASGWVGAAVTRELVAAGHHVLGLARSDAAAKVVAAEGGEVHRGSLGDLDGLRRGAAACDAVIHTAFEHDFSRFAASCAADQAAIEALGAALAGSGRPLIVTSGTGGLRTEDESPASNPALAAMPRRSEEVGLAMAAHGVRAMVVRLPPSVHGDGDHGFVPRLVGTARERGFAMYVGDGRNRWAAVHRFDAARVYRLALERGETGARFHAIGDEGVPVRAIAEVIARRLSVPAVTRTAGEADAILPFIGRFLALDMPSSCALTRERLGWRPTGPGLIADLEHGRYFDA